MDRNQLVGLTLISLILITYLQFFAPKPPPSAQPPATTQELPTVTAGKATATPRLSPAPTPPNSVFAPAVQGTEKEVVLENEVMRVTLTSHGGKVKQVLLKNYKDPYGEPLVLLDAQSSDMGFRLPVQGDAVYTSSLFFDTADHDQQVSDTAVASATFLLPVGPEQYLKHTFTLAGQGYTLEHAWEVVGLRSVLDATPIRFVWNDHIKRAEKDLKACRNKTTINYYLANDKFNALKEHASTSQERLLNSPVQWVGIKQRFFTAAIIAHTPFASGYVATTPTPQSTTTVKEAKMRLALPEVAPNEDPKGTFTFYFGPNDYYTLKQVTKGFAKNIYLGWPVVRWINQLLIMPLFTLLELYVSSYGLIIVLLVLVIKLLLLPLSYRSYISMAKMRVLKPSIDALKAKHGNDTQKIQIAQMNLYREMGINPLSGCIPVLLQMPILLAMFNFFPNAIALRQQAFLWANDLSTYDAILQLPFTIPAYGSHVSLFTLLMTGSTILYTWSNNELAASQDGPMKMMTYLMPLTFMFILNSFPAGLSFYYFVSNLVTFGQQSLIKRFVDEDKLLKKLEANRVANKDRKKSRFQLRLEEAMKAEGNKKPRPSKKNRPKK